MELRKLAILSTAHLHPLEAKHMNKYAYVANEECALFNTEPEMRSFYKNADLVCLSELLGQVLEKYDVQYVMFDPDVSVTEDFKSYDW
jgi:hypothetical protein